MSQSSNIKRAIAAIGLAGLVGFITSSDASAFHFGGFGGGHMAAPHFGGGGFGGGHASLAHFGGGGAHFGGSHFNGGSHIGRGSHFGGGGGSHQGRDTGAGRGRGKGQYAHGSHGHDGRGKTVAGHHEPKGGKGKHPREPQIGTKCHGGRHCGPVYARGPYPSYTPIYDRDDAPAPVYSNDDARPTYTPTVKAPVLNAPPVSTPAPSVPAKVCAADGTFVVIVFQPNATAMTITAFLKEYDDAIADGPNAYGMYRVKISTETLPVEQFGQMIDSMRSRKDVVASVDA